MHRILRLPALALMLVTGNVVAAGDESKNLIVTLDVPPDRAPGRVCVLSRYDACKNNKDCLTEMKSAILESIPNTEQYLFVGQEASGVMSKHVENMIFAANYRRDRITTRCDSTNLMCAPAIYLRNRNTVNDPNTRITCSRDDGSTNQRVVFLSLEFPTDNNDQPGVLEVKLTGTTATLVFQGKLDRRIRTVVQVIGGDYAPLATTRTGYDESLTVALIPRCRRVIAELPGFPAGGYNVTVTSDAKTTTHSGRCVGMLAQQTLSVELPVTAESELKSITATNIDFPDAVAKASWSTAIPAAPFRVPAHSFTFSWIKPTGCNAEAWTNKTDWRDPEREWSVGCPRAVLFDGSACRVSESNRYCEYACTVTSPAEAVTFPTPIRFERYRLDESEMNPNEVDETWKNPNEEIVYSWNDTLVYSGQALVSQVAPDDRRIMLEYDHPEQWGARGVPTNEVRLVSPDGVTSSQLVATQDKLRRWVAMKVPGACLREVTVAIFGSAVFDEQRVPVSRGVVQLGNPQNYRRKSRLELELGGGIQAQDGSRDGKFVGGGGLLLSYEPPLPVSIGLFGALRVTKKSFVAFDGSPGTADDEQVWIWRFALGGVFEYWLRRRLHLFLRGGIELDSPLSFDDDDKLGILEMSVPFEAGALLAVVPRRVWLSFGAGVDFDVEHNRFETELGPPTSESRNEFFFAARVRMRLR